MEKVKILGVDPSLRFTGLALIEYNTELAPNDPEAYAIKHCQVLVNPQKYKGKEALYNMIDMLYEASQKPCYASCDNVIIESPSTMFSKTFAISTLSMLAHVSGATIGIFGAEKSYLFSPVEWNRRTKKEVTHNRTVAFLGTPDNWGYEKRVKSDKHMEHILDAASMALWWVKSNYVEEEGE